MTSARPVLPSEEWDYLDVDVLRPARSGAVCITCQHFRYEVGRHCVTLLTCPIRQGLIPQGEHLTKCALSGSLGGRFGMGGAPRRGEHLCLRENHFQRNGSGRRRLT